MLLKSFEIVFSKFVVKTINLSLVFKENQNLVGLSPTMKDSKFQSIKREDFYTHYFIGPPIYVVILQHVILKLIIWRLSLQKNNYLLNFIDSCIKSFFNKLYTPKVMVPNVPKINLFVKLPFLGTTSFQFWNKLQELFSDKSASCNLRIVFTSPVRVKTFFTIKDKLPKMLVSGLVYKYKCGGCNATCYRKTKHHFKVQIFKRLGISRLKKVNIESNNLTAIREQLLCCNYSTSFEDFSILTRKSNDIKVKIMDSLLIARDRLILNKAASSLPLKLF